MDDKNVDPKQAEAEKEQLEALAEQEAERKAKHVKREKEREDYRQTIRDKVSLKDLWSKTESLTAINADVIVLQASFRQFWPSPTRGPISRFDHSLQFANRFSFFQYGLKTKEQIEAEKIVAREEALSRNLANPADKAEEEEGENEEECESDSRDTKANGARLVFPQFLTSMAGENHGREFYGMAL